MSEPAAGSPSPTHAGGGPRTRRSAKRALVDALQLVCETVWGVGFRSRAKTARRGSGRDGFSISRSLDPRPSSPRPPSDPLRVLAISPHPDDEMAGCGGALLLHRRAGHRAAIVQVTDGRRSQAFGLDPDDMAQRRRTEAEAAAEHLTIERLHWLGLPEGAWSEGDAVAQMAEVLESWRPQLIYAPSRIDFHRDHLRVARALAGALERVPLDGSARCYQAQVPLTGILVNCSLDIEEVGDELHRGLELYRTQYGSLERCLRMRRYAGRRRGRRLCEEHWQLTIPTFVRLHRALAIDPGRTAYRALRYLALTDPLAYLRGREQRHRAAALACGSVGRTPAEEPSREALPP